MSGLSVILSSSVSVSCIVLHCGFVDCLSSEVSMCVSPASFLFVFLSCPSLVPVSLSLLRVPRKSILTANCRGACVRSLVSVGSSQLLVQEFKG
eukprot:scaffold7899_cov111-Isochrysis_galbana.AAC.5